ncbi:hypothetical protein [Halorubrum sp. AJ67]|uniref:hypothetical protein n=1 Tax=Halorubrum sp. AJ67 TaxID=1173487 RepID=UPI0003DC23C7|nr:hypothetical protein [Halorubrum sp. AJ67]CDK38209.1 hypothetical protein BN903_409 [Halorubrum sp. AJ67]
MSNEPAEANGVTIHTTNGETLDVQHVVRHFEKDWAYASRITNDDTVETNRLVIRTENIVAIDAKHIMRTTAPKIRIHHSGNGEDFDHEDGNLAFELDPDE